MFKKIAAFFLSYGIVILGVILLFVGAAITLRRLQIAYPDITFPILSTWFPVASPPKPVVVKEDRLPESKPLPPIKKNNADFSGALSARAVVVVDDVTGQLLWSKNSSDIRPLASISKLMSMLVLSDLHLDMASTTVVVAADSDGTSQIRVGERYTLGNLWEASLVGSSNMAVRTLVRASGLTTDEFVARMNSKAQELHLSTMRFVESTGLSAQNVGSAEDVARLLSIALACDAVHDALSEPSCSVKPVGGQARQVWSTNMLLTDWVPNDFKRVEAIGKTGHIEDSGYNFVVRLSRPGGRAIRVVILGANSNELRFSEARDVGEWIFENYMWPGEEGYRAKLE